MQFRLENTLLVRMGAKPRGAVLNVDDNRLRILALELADKGKQVVRCSATDTTANGRTVRALPIDALTALLKKYGR